MSIKPKLVAAVMSIGIISLPGVVRAVTLFQDDFSTDTAVFSYPDTTAAHLPAPTSGTGSWVINNASPYLMEAGVITNTLPGGGTGGANGNTHYMAMQRSASLGDADAVFSSPSGASGNLSVQWDMYDVGPGTNWVIFLSDTPDTGGNIGPYIEASYTPTGSGPAMEIASRTGPSATYNDLAGYHANQWYHMDMEVNLAAQHYQLLVNGSSLGTWGYINNSGSEGPFKSLIFDGASNQGETLYIDNVSAVYTPVPEPATLSLLSACSLFLIRRRGRASGINK